jgi:hypothetical protein
MELRHTLEKRELTGGIMRDETEGVKARKEVYCRIIQKLRE